MYLKSETVEKVGTIYFKNKRSEGGDKVTSTQAQNPKFEAFRDSETFLVLQGYPRILLVPEKFLEMTTAFSSSLSKLS